jgi:hypothetical protein
VIPAGKNEEGRALCPCCGAELTLRWTDHHGIAECGVCGVALGIEGYGKFEETTVLLDAVELEACQAYWKETSTRMIWGDTHRWGNVSDTAEERAQHMKAWMQEHRPEVAAIWYRREA